MNFGNKAGRLIELHKAGFKVPNLVVLPNELFETFQVDKCINNKLLDRLKQYWKTLQLNKPVAVRSSANCEDSSKAAFAGLFESVLSVRTESEFIQAVETVWLSATSERVRKYLEANDLKRDDVFMHAFVQEMVDADFSGVAFTLNPSTGHDDQVVVNYCEGLGDKLVAGHESGLDFLLYRNKENKSENFSEDLQKKMLQTFCNLQLFFGKPQDIEFSIKDEAVWVLQSRDITAVNFSAEFGEWTTADLRDGGVSARLPSPFMASLYHDAVERSFAEYFSEIKLISKEESKNSDWCKLAFGRLYWNLGLIKSLLQKVPGFNERNFDEDISAPIAYDDDGRTTPMNLLNIVRVLPTAVALSKRFKEQYAWNEKFLQKFEENLALYKEMELGSLSESEFVSLYQKLLFEFHPEVEVNYFKTIYNTSNAKLEFQSELEKVQKIDNSIAYVDLISGLDSLKVLQPNHALWEIASLLQKELKANKQQAKELLTKHPALCAAIEAFIENFGHHAEIELDLRTPRWAEDKSFIYETLISMANDKLKQSPEVLEEKQKAKYSEAFLKAKKVQAKFSLAYKLSNGFEKKLNLVRNYTWMREEMRECSTKVYMQIRRFTLEAERRLKEFGLSQELSGFDLTPRQILNGLSKQNSLDSVNEAISTNRSYFEGFKNYPAPNEIGSPYAVDDSKKIKFMTSGNLSGIGSSSGNIRGKARVLNDIDESHKLQNDEILIAPFTDPGWTPLFGIAKGVVTETGGMLSHAAVIAREYGIPAVLNVKDATKQIKTGQEIVVDGSKGHVFIVSDLRGEHAQL